MPPRSVAALEIDQTLRLARDEVEVRIASYRVWAFAAAVAIALFVYAVQVALGITRSLVPDVCFGVAVLYAIVLRAIVSRVGARRWLILLSLALNLGFSAASFFFVHLFGSPEVRAESPLFAGHILGASTGLLLMLNALRGDAVASVVGSVLASLLVAGVLLPNRGIPTRADRHGAHLLDHGRGRRRRGSPGEAHPRQLRPPPAPASLPFPRGRRARDARAPRRRALPRRSLLTVTLLSADLRGFTTMSESLSPDEVVRQLNEFHGAMLEQNRGARRRPRQVHRRRGPRRLRPRARDRARLHETAEGDAGAKRAVELRASDGPRARVAQRRAGPSRGGGTEDGYRRPHRSCRRREHRRPRAEARVHRHRRRGEHDRAAGGDDERGGTSLLVSADTAERLDDRQGLRELAPMTARGKTSSMRVFGLA